MESIPTKNMTGDVKTLWVELQESTTELMGNRKRLEHSKVDRWKNIKLIIKSFVRCTALKRSPYLDIFSMREIKLKHFNKTTAETYPHSRSSLSLVPRRLMQSTP